MVKNLKSVYTQSITGNGDFGLDYNQTYLYFGNDNRITFTSLEIINFRTIKKHLEQLIKKGSDVNL